MPTPPSSLARLEGPAGRSIPARPSRKGLVGLGEIGGMAAMVPAARLIVEADKSERKRIAKAYREGVFGGCGKSLACRNICPAGIDTDKLMSRSNAAAIWDRF